MADVFISYVEEDSAAAGEIAERLRDEGISSWRYEQDSIAGTNYLLQTREEIEKCDVFLIILSPSSVGSKQIDVEVVRAHECNRPCLPVLVELTYAEFAETRPDWQQAMGAAAGIAVDDVAQLPDVLDRVVAGVCSLAQRSDLRPKSTSPWERTKARWRRRLKSPRTYVVAAAIAIVVGGAIYGRNAWNEAVVSEATTDAISHIDRGEYIDAMEAVNKVLDIDPDDSFALTLRGNIHYKELRYDEAIADLDRALEIDPKNGLAMFYRGRTKFFQKEDKAAVEDLTAALDAGQHEYAEVYWYRAKAYHELGDTDLALDDLDEAIEIDPAPYSGYELRAEINSNLGRYNDAVRDYTAVLDRLKRGDPKIGDTYVLRGLMLGRQLEKNQSASLAARAIDDLNRAIEISPDDLLVYFLRGSMHNAASVMERAANGRSDRAEQLRRSAVADYAHFLARDKDESDFIKQRVARMPESEQPELDYQTIKNIATSQIDLLTAGLGSNADPVVVDAFLDAEAFYDAGQSPRALAPLDFVLKELPDFYDALVLRGRSLTAMSRFDEARPDFDRAIKVDPKSASARFQRGYMWYKQGKNQKALDDLNVAIELNPKGSNAFFYRGNAYAALNQLEKAVADYDKAIELYDTDPWYYYERGFTQGRLNRQEEAIEDLTKSIKLSNDRALSSKAYHFRGFAQYRLADDPRKNDKWGSAIDDFSQAIRLGPARPDSYGMRGVGRGIAVLWNTSARATTDADKELARSAQADLKQFLKLNKVETFISRSAKHVIKELELVLTDESTGRVEPKNSWAEYLQALEKKYETGPDKSTGIREGDVRPVSDRGTPSPLKAGAG